MKYTPLYATFLMLAFYSSCSGQHQEDRPASNTKASVEDGVTSGGPNHITRNILQDKKGNIWIAAFDGIFRYDGESFTKVTNHVSSARFLSVLADSKGNMWFGSIGSGAYFYDGKSFQNFTTTEGLLNNEIVSMYEDKKGNTWFGVNGGVSRYDGRSFRNYMTDGDLMREDSSGKTRPDFKRPPTEVNAIIEDRSGKFWFATRGNTFVYDGKTFSAFTHGIQSFKNVRSIIEDKNGHIWLGGAGGLWRYDGHALTNFSRQFVGYVYEDNHGNIWTSSESNYTKSLQIDGKGLSNQKGWTLSRYPSESLVNPLMPPEIIRTNEGMIFGILEAADGSIWFGTLAGVYRYDGRRFTDFKGAAAAN